LQFNVQNSFEYLFSKLKYSNETFFLNDLQQATVATKQIAGVKYARSFFAGFSTIYIEMEMDED